MARYFVMVMDLFTQPISLSELCPGDIFKFGKDYYFSYRFVERLQTLEGVVLYDFRHCSYIVHRCLLSTVEDTQVYLLTDEEKQKIKKLY